MNADIIVLILLLIVTLAALGLSFYLYHWRRVLIAKNGDTALMPEAMAEVIAKYSKTIDSFQHALGTRWYEFEQRMENAISGSLERLDVSRDMAEAISRRDAEIEKLASGYEHHLLKRIATNFVMVDEFLYELSDQETITSEDIQNALLFMKQALNSCGITHYEPAIDSDYRDLGDKLSDSYETETGEPEKDFRIVAVLRTGYIMQGPVNDAVIRPARVRISLSGKTEA